MFTRPDLDESQIVVALHTVWGIEAAVIRYAAVGFGSHHWIATGEDGTQHFVTVDDLAKLRLESDPEVAFARLNSAFATARALRDAGLTFVVPPLPDLTGNDVLHRLNAGFSMAVFPMVDGEVRAESERERLEVLGLLDLLHSATAEVASLADREDFHLPCRSDLEAALGELDHSWAASGPYGERARTLLIDIQPQLGRALGFYDGLAEQLSGDTDSWVLTHGEPHAQNVMWTADGPCLVDWDTALVAPAGRDLWMVATPEEANQRGQAAAAHFYRLWYDLAEIAGYVAEFRRPHSDTRDTQESWRNLQHFAQGGLYTPSLSQEEAERILHWHERAYAEGRAMSANQVCDYLGLTIEVPPGVMPITPMSHLLGEAVLADVHPGDRVLDIGTGSGVNGILAASKQAEVIAVDINPHALEAAAANAARNNVSGRIEFRHSDVFAAVPETFDLIVFDPPFRWFRPRDLLEAAMTDEGYRGMTTFFRQARHHLKPGGRMLIFFGTTGDLAYLQTLFTGEGFSSEVVAHDDLVRDGHQVDYFTYRLI